MHRRTHRHRQLHAARRQPSTPLSPIRRRLEGRDKARPCSAPRASRVAHAEQKVFVASSARCHHVRRRAWHAPVRCSLAFPPSARPSRTPRRGFRRRNTPQQRAMRRNETTSSSSDTATTRNARRTPASAAACRFPLRSHSSPSAPTALSTKPAPVEAAGRTATVPHQRRACRDAPPLLWGEWTRVPVNKIVRFPLLFTATGAAFLPLPASLCANVASQPSEPLGDVLRGASGCVPPLCGALWRVLRDGAPDPLGVQIQIQIKTRISRRRRIGTWSCVYSACSARRGAPNGVVAGCPCGADDVTTRLKMRRLVAKMQFFPHEGKIAM